MRDYSRRQGFNAIFGDAVSARRTPTLSLAWQYGQNTYDTTEAVTGTGAVTYANSMAKVSTGASTGTARLESISALRYQSGFDGYAYFTTIFTTPEADTYQRAGIFDASNGFFVGYEGEDFQFTIRAGGSDTAATLTDDGVNGFNLDKLTIWRISYGYLGSAPVVLERYVDLEAGWTVVAAYDKAGQLTRPHVDNPSLKWAIEVGRTSGSGAVTLQNGSAATGRIGADLSTGVRHFSRSNAKTISGSTLTNILTIRNKATFASVTNMVSLILDQVSVAADGNKPVRAFLYLNATLGGSPSYNDNSAAISVVDFDVAGTTVTGGTEIYSVAFGKADGATSLMKAFGIEVHPGETITLAVESAQASDIVGSILWEEAF